MGPPKVLGPPKPTSSISTMTTLGALAGRLDLEPRRRLGVPRIEFGVALAARAPRSAAPCDRSPPCAAAGAAGCACGGALQPASVSDTLAAARKTSSSRSHVHTPSGVKVPHQVYSHAALLGPMLVAPRARIAHAAGIAGRQLSLPESRRRRAEGNGMDVMSIVCRPRDCARPPRWQYTQAPAGRI